MLQRNLDITRKEKEKRGFSLSNNNPNGPIINNQTTDTQNNEDQKFQDMLKRNLDITQKEKEKRGFSLNNKNK